MRGIAWGIALSLLLFALELWQVLRNAGTAGVHVDTQEALAAGLRAVYPALGWILLKIASVYALGGAILGLCAAALTSAFGARHPRALFALELVILWALLTVHRAVAHPALFDDLPAIAPLLDGLMTYGRPAWAAIAIGAWLLGHCVVARGRRGRMAFAAVSVALAFAALVSPYSWRRLRRPGPGNLVLVVGIDALRPDRAAAYGGPGRATPHLDRFFAEANLFTQAYTAIAQTEPGWRSLLTANWPQRTGVRFPLTADEDRLPIPTFASTFGQAGFQTYFATDCARFNHQEEDSGFAHRDQPPRGLLNFALDKARFRGVALFGQNPLGAAVLPELVLNRAVAGLYDPTLYIEQLGDRLIALTRSGPTLAAVHLTAAHFPGDPSYPFYRGDLALDRDVPVERRTRMHFATLTSQPARSDAKGGAGQPQRFGSRAQAEGLYDELIAQADWQVGSLIERLKGAGLYDRTELVVFSDHGESFYADRPDLAGATSVHGARVSGEENHVVLAYKSGASASSPPMPPRRIDRLVRLLDLGPTLLEGAELPPLPNVDGVSLRPLLRGEEMPPLWLYAETGFTHASPDVFEPRHRSGGAPRDQSLYRFHADGSIDVDPKYRQAIIDEKDHAATDGQSWLWRQPARDGAVLERCEGDCIALRPWLLALERDAL